MTHSTECPSSPFLSFMRPYRPSRPSPPRQEHGRGAILDPKGCKVCDVECAAGLLVGGRTVCPGSLGGGKGPKCRGASSSLLHHRRRLLFGARVSFSIDFLYTNVSVIHASSLLLYSTHGPSLSPSQTLVFVCVVPVLICVSFLLGADVAWGFFGAVCCCLLLLALVLVLYSQ